MQTQICDDHEHKCKRNLEATLSPAMGGPSQGKIANNYNTHNQMFANEFGPLDSWQVEQPQMLQEMTFRHCVSHTYPDYLQALGCSESDPILAK